MAPPKAAPGKAVVPAKKEQTGVAKIDTKLLMEDAKQDLGFGKDDLAIPFLRVLQKGSPQVNKRDPLYVEGAEPGFFFNTVSNELWDGEEGVVIVPVHYTPSYIEWRPREEGGGIVKDHGADASCLQGTTKDDKNRDVTPDGNHIVRSGLYYVMIVDPETGKAVQAAFALSSTQLKKSRKWNSLISTLTVPHPESGQQFRPAPFYMSYMVTTVPESNDQGDWMGVKIEYHKPVTELPDGGKLYLDAREFKKLVGEGKVQTAMPEGEEAAPGDDKAF